MNSQAKSFGLFNQSNSLTRIEFPFSVLNDEQMKNEKTKKQMFRRKKPAVLKKKLKQA